MVSLSNHEEQALESLMSQHRERRRLAYPADQLFDLVADVESYPKFLPWCSEAKIVGRETKDGRAVLIADLVISFKVHKERFRSEVTLDRAARVIDTRYVDGPFKHMQSQWRFEPDGEAATMVGFSIDFQFKNRALQMLIGLLFEEAVRRIVSAFEDRARVLYGRKRFAGMSG
jgi:coenzyme Q-binding protein COQ10